MLWPELCRDRHIETGVERGDTKGLPALLGGWEVPTALDIIFRGYWLGTGEDIFDVLLVLRFSGIGVCLGEIGIKLKARLLVLGLWGTEGT